MSNKFILIASGFVYYYIKSTLLFSFSYIAIIFKNKIYYNKLTIILFLYTFTISIYVIIYSYFVNNDIALYNLLNCLRYYFGFLFFYAYFTNNFNIFNIEKILILLFSLVLIEFSYLNFLDFGFKNITLNLNNFPPCILISESSSCNFEYKTFGIFQRPHGFGAHPAISSVILIALMSIYKKKSIIFEGLLIINIFLLASGTGYICYFLYLIDKFRKNKYVMLLLMFLIICSLIFFQKYSYINIYNLIIDKYIKILSEISLTINIENILKSVENGKYGGDFAIAFFVQNFGIATSILFLFFIYRHINKTNYFAILIIIFSSFHYGTPFSVPGQIIFGYCLAYMNDKHNKSIRLYENTKILKLLKKHNKKINSFLLLIIISISIFDYEKKGNINLHYGPQKPNTFSD